MSNKVLQIKTPAWAVPLLSPARYKGAHGGRGCCHPDTLIDTPKGQVKISHFGGGDVYAFKDGEIVIARATPAISYHLADMYEVILLDGRSITVTDQHRFLTGRGWVECQNLCIDDDVVCSDELKDVGVTAWIVDKFRCRYPGSICKSYRHGKVKLLPVVGIKRREPVVYWDLSVPIVKNYLSNGIVNHNSGKSHFFAEMMIEEHIMNPDQASVCIREYQKSMDQSVKRLLEMKIESLNAGYYFEVQDKTIRRHGGKGLIVFQGMQNHTADSIKSLESFHRAWIEEAQSLSALSLRLLRPTMRSDDSEMWFGWNPNEPTDPVDEFFRGKNKHPESIVVEANFTDNPWFPDSLRKDFEYDMEHDPEMARHVWFGEYLSLSSTRVFNNWMVEEFEAPEDVVLRFGADWGFANDPTVLVRCYVVGRKLYVDYEAYMVGCEITDTPDLFLTVPEAERWPIVADSSRPEVISHMRKHGFPKLMPAVKGAKSVEEGIRFLKGYTIVVHPRCKHLIEEMRKYSYKVDPDTEKVLPVLADKHNHVVDSLRYATEGVRRIKEAKRLTDCRPMATVNRW